MAVAATLTEAQMAPLISKVEALYKVDRSAQPGEKLSEATTDFHVRLLISTKDIVLTQGTHTQVRGQRGRWW